MGVNARRTRARGWRRRAAAALLLTLCSGATVAVADESLAGRWPGGPLDASRPQLPAMAPARASVAPHDVVSSPARGLTATAEPMAGAVLGAARSHSVAAPRALELLPLPRDPAPPSLDELALRSLARLDGARIELGVVGFGPRTRDMRLRAEIRLEGGVPALGGWLHINLASRHLALPLPSVQVIPNPRGGLFAFEVRTILIERTF